MSEVAHVLQSFHNSVKMQMKEGKEYHTYNPILAALWPPCVFQYALHRTLCLRGVRGQTSAVGTRCFDPWLNLSVLPLGFSRGLYCFFFLLFINFQCAPLSGGRCVLVSSLAYLPSLPWVCFSAGWLCSSLPECC